MTWLAGTDGCPSGWLCVRHHLQRQTFDAVIFADAKSLLLQDPQPTVHGIDMPIGLTASGPRECDQLARKHLGWPRSASVFNPPIRPALHASDWAAAAAITERVDGKRIAKQAWGIYPKIRELDAALRHLPRPRRQAVREVHPELAFLVLNQGVAIRMGKRTAGGRKLRQQCIEQQFGSSIFQQIRAQFTRRQAADDDILDALAVLWSAHRIWRGQAQCLPNDPPRDEQGLPMEILF